MSSVMDAAEVNQGKRKGPAMRALFPPPTVPDSLMSSTGALTYTAAKPPEERTLPP